MIKPPESTLETGKSAGPRHTLVFLSCLCFPHQPASSVYLLGPGCLVIWGFLSPSPVWPSSCWASHKYASSLSFFFLNLSWTNVIGSAQAEIDLYTEAVSLQDSLTPKQQDPTPPWLLEIWSCDIKITLCFFQHLTNSEWPWVHSLLMIQTRE